MVVIPVLIHPRSTNLARVQEAIDLYNQIQTHFQLRPTIAAWLPNDNKERNTTPAAQLRKTIESRHPSKPVIAVIQNPFRGSWFSTDYRGICIVSAASWDAEFAPPPLKVYLAYQFAYATAYLTADLSESQLEALQHEQVTGCIFDESSGREEFRVGLIAAHLCAECEAVLAEMGVADPGLDAINDVLAYVRAVTIRRARALPTRIFIGHGHSPTWKEARRFLEEELHLIVEEFNQDVPSGLHTSEKLAEMLDRSRFALLIMTAEDFHGDGQLHARENVVHEIGLFQGRLGFRKAIVVKEDGAATFSNIAGLTHISFPCGAIVQAFRDITRTLLREGVVDAAVAQAWLACHPA
jgi:hypothetical protein